MQSAHSAADTVQMGFESTGGIVQASFLPSISSDQKVTTRYSVNKHSSFFLPAQTRGVDGSVTVCSADKSNDYVFSNYSLHYGQRVASDPTSHNAQFSVRSTQWYSEGRYSSTTAGSSYHQGTSKTWMLPIVSTVTDPSGSMVPCSLLSYHIACSIVYPLLQVGVFGMTIRLSFLAASQAPYTRRVFIVEPNGYPHYCCMCV